MEINQYKLKIRQHIIELEKPLDREQRLFVLSEFEVYDVSHPSRQENEEYDEVYIAKLVGSSEIKQQGKVVKGQSKRSASQRLRQAIFNLNPDENFYQIQMDKVISNIEPIIEFLKDK